MNGNFTEVKSFMWLLLMELEMELEDEIYQTSAQ